MNLDDLKRRMEAAGFTEYEVDDERLIRAAMTLISWAKSEELMMNPSQRAGVQALIETAVGATLKIAGLHTVSLTREMMEKVVASTRYTEGTMTIILHGIQGEQDERQAPLWRDPG
jgi:hypothetical protein